MVFNRHTKEKPIFQNFSPKPTLLSLNINFQALSMQINKKNFSKYFQNLTTQDPTILKFQIFKQFQCKQSKKPNFSKYSQNLIKPQDFSNFVAVRS